MLLVVGRYQMLSDEIKTYIKENEGVRYKPYRCSAGKLTIGVGRNLDDNGLSDDEVDYLFNNDLQVCLAHAVTIFDNFTEYPNNVKTVVIDMLFNLGSTRFKTFKKFIKAIKEYNLPEACKQIEDSNYYKQVPNRAKRNIKLLKA
jgi:lysozyme